MPTRRHQVQSSPEARPAFQPRRKLPAGAHRAWTEFADAAGARGTSAQASQLALLPEDAKLHALPGALAGIRPRCRNRVWHSENGCSHKKY